ncbi:MAG: aldehyde ferredoxin oxidoreductase N-terminal domain-containing protein [Elusimicrobiota bacterium]|nr:aldehyde ferredoxin oxidoreductase N-terminal domain-containing protein [Elusimicrobiota bacterium]
MKSSYCKKYLRIDLTKGKIEKSTTPDELIENYLGGNGFGTKILFDEVSPKVDALSPENKLIFATGPLTGTLWPSSGRLSVISKSPLTGIYGDASSGGFFAPELKYAGYDMIVIEGRAKTPVYIYIENDFTQLRSAKYLMGKDTYTTEELIRKELFDEDIKVACIGQAGENLVRFASIMVSYGRTAARSGLGAVMGSKNLKAIAVRGTGKIEVANPEKFYQAAYNAHQLIRQNEFTPGETKYGTPALVKLMSEVGRLPTKNFQLGHFIYADEISAEALEEKHVTKHLACFCCPIGCDKRYEVKDGEFAGTVSTSVEYETLCSLGAKCFNRNLASIIKMDKYCNSVGMDTISAGGVISFVMELYEKKLLSKKDLDGLDLTWGNYHSMIELLQKIAYRKSCM